MEELDRKKSGHRGRGCDAGNREGLHATPLLSSALTYPPATSILEMRRVDHRDFPRATTDFDKHDSWKMISTYVFR